MKFNQNKSYLKVVNPYVYTAGELADVLRVSYSDVVRRKKSGEFPTLSGRDTVDYRFSYFTLPKWVQDLLPVPMAVMPQVKRYKFEK